MKDVVKCFPDAKLILAGNGPEKNNLEEEIKSLGLEKSIQLIGYCITLEKYQKASQVLVACSHREGMPLNLIEAMLTGNPVVASINRGHKELVKEGKNGYLVDTAQAMGEKVIGLLDDRDKREEMGRSAIEYAKKYGFKNVRSELERIYFEEE
jgi:glycosyltransferase EpsD